MAEKRLGNALIDQHLVIDARDAFILVTEGRVLVNGQKAISPSQPVSPGARIEVRNSGGFVGRGGLKLDAALEQFAIDVSGAVCIDIGAATGGFTDVLLQRGARRVYAIDTARGKFALHLRNDERVVLMERTDIRNVESLPEVADIAVVDVSLIPLRDILSHVRRLLKPDGLAVALFKPQYETRDPRHLRGGVIRTDAIRESLVAAFEEWAAANGWDVRGRIVSPIKGGKGNVEYLYEVRPCHT